jgi:thymidylate synthase ThyX
MLSSPLAEIRRIAEGMLAAALTVTPTLVKYAAKNEHRAGLGAAVADKMRTIYDPPSWDPSATNVMHQPVRLVRYDKSALERIALVLAYEGSEPPLHAHGLADGLHKATESELEAVVRASLDARGPHDAPPRAFEAATMTFELMLDYGAYRDLQRHRMLLPATQRLTCRLGFDSPAELNDLGFAEPYLEAMFAARDTWELLEAERPLEAQYAVPLGFRIRTLWTLDLRELFHVIELRSAKQGHQSYRRIAQALYRVAVGVHPWLEGLVRVDLADYPLARA